MRASATLAAVASLLLVVGVAGADSVAHRPLHVVRASLTQDGQDLIWKVDLGHPFSVAGLRQRHRSLCLQLERGRRGVAFELVCLGENRNHKRMRLFRMRVRSHSLGAERAIASSLSRGTDHSLTARFRPAAVGIGYRDVRWQVLNTLKPPACRPTTPNPLGCRSFFPSQPAQAKIHVPQVAGCAPSGSPYVTSGPSRGRKIALTFDDGPWPDTPQFLRILEREHVPATFFQIGEQVSTYGRSVDRRMLADGDMIGDHTWSHANVSGAGSRAASQISSTASAISQVTGGFKPCLFRAPGGAVSSALISEARSMGFTTIEWDIDPRDWARPGTGAIYSNVVSNAHAGAIVIQHDGGGDRSETLAALPHEIDTLRHDGYHFVTVTDLLRQRLIYK